MADELTQPDMSLRPHLLAVMHASVESWVAAAKVLGPEIAGDPLSSMTDAILTAGYARVFVCPQCGEKTLTANACGSCNMKGQA